MATAKTTSKKAKTTPVDKPKPEPKAKPKSEPKAKPEVKTKKPIGRPKLKAEQKVGRPKKALPIRIAQGYKRVSTGDTSESPGATSNIVFLLGVGLVIVSGFSSGRIKDAFTWMWNPNQNVGTLLTFLRITGTQLLAVLILSFLSRASPAMGRIFTIVLVGVWILWLMRNPQILQLLDAASKG